MPRVHFVKKARKKNPVAKKGESYYWWAFMVGGRGGPKRYSKTPPKPSQLTQSEFLSTLYGIQEDMGAASPTDFSDLQSMLENWISELENLRDETQSKYDNMPDGLQQGDTGQMLESRVSELESYISDLQGIDCDFDSPEYDDEETMSEKAPEDYRALLEEKLSEITGCSYNGE